MLLVRDSSSGCVGAKHAFTVLLFLVYKMLFAVDVLHETNLFEGSFSYVL